MNAQNKKLLTAEFYEGQNAPELARSLLGKLIEVERSEGTLLSGIINETEAYTQDDPASHCYGGKMTARNKTMFESGGHIYVYTSYGIHRCMNIVSGQKGLGSGVLIRSILPVDGIEIMTQLRNNVAKKSLTNGPGKLCQALGITSDYDGHYVLDPDSRIKVYDVNYILPKIQATPRIGISKATETLWRFTF